MSSLRIVNTPGLPKASTRLHARGCRDNSHNRPRPRACRDMASCTPQESQVESCEHQDDANIHYQPFPESVSEEHQIYPDYDGYHRHHTKHDSLSAHFESPESADF